MTKLEIKEYLNKIYNVEVTRVNTCNVLGRILYECIHLFIGKGYRYGRSATMKEPDWKKAYVFINPNYKPKEMNGEEAVNELKKN